ncbi:MAG: sensor domain-containing phosphodiesterase [Burkholderiaceae bacterium]|nr:sensor domain-containing phosphodiesterase [Burkholderiaceae bacterium]
MSIDLPQLAALAAHLDDPVVGVDARGRVVVLSQGAQSLFGVRAADVLGAAVTLLPGALFAPAQGAGGSGGAPAAAAGDIESLSVLGRRGNGSEIELRVTIVRGGQGEGAVTLAFVRPAQQPGSRDARVAQPVFDADSRRAVLDALPANVVLLDAQARIVETNAQWRAFGRENGLALSDDGVGADYLAICRQSGGADAEDAELIARGIADVLSGRSDQASSVYRCDAPGLARWFQCMIAPVETAGARGAVVMHVDVTERIEWQERLLQMAHFDGLTELPTRLLFRDRLRTMMALARRNGWRVAVVFIDIDRFKYVNDTLGHDVGDELLREIARRLVSQLRVSDTVGRAGGDEFVVALGEVSDPHAAGRVARKLLDALAEPAVIDSHEIFITASAGVTLFPDDSDEIDTLLRDADTAMSVAKGRGRNGVQFYTPAMNQVLVARMRTERELRRAIARGEFELHFQPKVGSERGAIVGVEALIRWRHPERGVVLPGEFIGVLEDTGLINEVGHWVLAEACAALRTLREEDGAQVTMAVNVSPRQLSSPGFFRQVQDVLAGQGVDPRWVELELTEGYLLSDPVTAGATLRRLRGEGVRLALDDFGTGYSSLSHLRDFAFDTIKIDRMFVHEIETSGSDATIARAIIMMAHSLGLRVIAEGIETEGQLRFFINEGCDAIQGFYFSRPVPFAELRAIVRAGRRIEASLLDPGAADGVPV